MEEQPHHKTKVRSNGRSRVRIPLSEGAPPTTTAAAGATVPPNPGQEEEEADGQEAACPTDAVQEGGAGSHGLSLPELAQ